MCIRDSLYHLFEFQYYTPDFVDPLREYPNEQNALVSFLLQDVYKRQVVFPDDRESKLVHIKILSNFVVRYDDCNMMYF